MSKLLLKFFLCSFIFFEIYASEPKEDQLPEPSPFVKMTVHNVGQGNFISLKLFDPEKGSKPQYLLVDAGSLSHKKEEFYTSHRSTTATSSAKLKDSQSEERSSEEASSPSPTERSDFEEILKGHKQDIKDITSEKSAQEIRLKLGGETIESPLVLKTVIITHPERDHYSWLPSLLKDQDKIEHLILGGEAKQYFPESKRARGTRGHMGRLIKNLRQKGTKIYFPAHQKEGSITSISDVYPKTLKDIIYAEAYYTQVDHSNLIFKEALDFGKNIKIYFLAVNPTHHKKESGEVIRSLEHGNNADSLVLKIEFKRYSLILPGDAPGSTTDFILKSYANNLDFLKAHVLVASHHGSDTQETNNEKWIKAVQPEYVFISNGHHTGYGHPTLTAYNNFKLSPRLKRIQRHPILIGPSHQYSKGSKHKTVKGIFSTLSSGDLTAEFSKDTFSIITEKDHKIQEVSSILEEGTDVEEDKEGFTPLIQTNEEEKVEKMEGTREEPSQPETKGFKRKAEEDKSEESGINEENDPLILHSQESKEIKPPQSKKPKIEEEKKRLEKQDKLCVSKGYRVRVYDLGSHHLSVYS